MSTTHSLRLTARDWQFLANLGEVTVLSFEVIRRRYFASDATGKSCQRRLRYLSEAKLVAPVAVTACFGNAADRHRVYRLTQAGADLLGRRTGWPARVLRTDPRPETLLHRVLVARTILAMTARALAAGRPRPLWLLEQDRWPDAPRDVPEPRQYRLAFDFLAVPVATGRPLEQYGWPVYDDPKATLIKARPDAACLLTLGDASAPVPLLFEVDTGQETHAQLLRKLPGYHALLSRRSYERSWSDIADGLPGAARVLFVFTSDERMRNVLDAIAAEPTKTWAVTGGYTPTPADRQRAAAFIEVNFRFTTLGELEASACLTRPIWSTLHRRAVSDRLPIERR
jgi:hypothetical protein